MAACFCTRARRSDHGGAGADRRDYRAPRLSPEFPFGRRLIAGAMTDTPALAYIGTLSGRNIAAVAYSTVYPVSMFLRILSGQLVLLFVWGAIAESKAAGR